MVAMAATDTARGLLSLGTAMAATATGTAMVAMAATDTARGLLSLGMATATTVEHRRRCHLNLQTYKCPCICDQLRVLNYARNKKKYCSFGSQVYFRTLV